MSESLDATSVMPFTTGITPTRIAQLGEVSARAPARQFSFAREGQQPCQSSAALQSS
jgi:hypothetical protein